MTDSKPDSIICKYCNKRLEHSKIKLCGNFFSPWLLEDCSCKDSINAKIEKERQQQLEKERLEAEEIAKIKNQKYEKLFKQSQMGERFANRTFENFKTKDGDIKAYVSCKKYSESFDSFSREGTGLVLVGSYGVGKTHLAGAILIELMRKNIPCIFVPMTELLSRLKDTYARDSINSENDYMNSYFNCNLLVIDDLGKEKPSEWSLEKLYSIINYRYEHMKPIVITTNYDVNTLINRLSVGGNADIALAIMSRLQEMCQFIKIDGVDHRGL